MRYYTPVNEIYVTAKSSAKDGVWNEQLKSDRGFVTALKHTVAASIMGTQQIAKHRPDCIIVQSESAEFIARAARRAHARCAAGKQAAFPVPGFALRELAPMARQLTTCTTTG
ncbi:MAG: hypothetical protein WKG07_22940 [Hymenobacter sp.]